MVRYLGPKNRIARRFGANVFGRMKNPLLKRTNPPGMHGAKRKKKSEFGLVLEEKQKLKACYGIMTEKQLVGAYRKALQEEGNTAQLLMEKLECRLDNLVYRLKFGRTLFAAQQLVSHGHIMVNGRKVDRRSFLVKPGMVIAVREKSRKLKAIQDSLETAPREVPDYMSLEKEQFSGKLLMVPDLSQVEGQLPLPINVPLICDFLAHHN